MPKKIPQQPEKLLQKTIQKMQQAGLCPAQFSTQNNLLSFTDRIKNLFNQLHNYPTKHTNMLALITYDIEDNRIRRNIAKYLERKGLMRLQKSVFFANLPRKQLADIKETLIKINKLYHNYDSILILPIPDDYINKLTCIGKDLSINVYLENKNTIFI